MRKLKLILSALLFLSVTCAGVYVGLQAGKAGLGEFTLIGGLSAQPLAVWLVASFIAGVSLACALGVFIVTQLQFSLLQARNKLKKREKELSNMRTLSLSDGS